MCCAPFSEVFSTALLFLPGLSFFSSSSLVAFLLSFLPFCLFLSRSPSQSEPSDSDSSIERQIQAKHLRFSITARFVLSVRQAWLSSPVHAECLYTFFGSARSYTLRSSSFFRSGKGSTYRHPRVFSLFFRSSPASPDVKESFWVRQRSSISLCPSL